MSVVRCSVLATGSRGSGGGLAGELWAHSANGRGVGQRVADHLRGTAERARVYGDVFGAGDLTWFLGLAHDVGKAHCAWQDGLLTVEGTRKPVGTDHKSAGAWLAQSAAG